MRVTDDHRTLAPAGAAFCYPFLLKGFHALVGTPAVTPSLFTILSAAAVLAIAIAVPFIGLAFALRPTASAGAPTTCSGLLAKMCMRPS